MEKIMVTQETFNALIVFKYVLFISLFFIGIHLIYFWYSTMKFIKFLQKEFSRINKIEIDINEED